MPHQRRDQLLQEQPQQRPANDGQVEIVNLEQPIQLHGRPALHELASAEDNEVVEAQRDGRLAHGGHGRLAGREAELLGLVAEEGLVGLGEEGPEFQTEGAVEGRGPDLEPVRGRHGSGGWRWVGEVEGEEGEGFAVRDQADRVA